ncbi:MULTISPECIES: LysR family transcriptional regulator [Micromonospora]|uniref:LysR family transcriptional regulator n=1 Tax=Micromonospora TaxID=1873 RepID=UPI001EE98147|nr:MULTISPECIES: LysR family transcriptional regulator [Micromonospora]MCG5448550.1 LysR family transcriptional regulator [Micromonospora hortensis]MCX5119372.1 LysR family transcriptional regulator [Micromonospora sp. NBC_00362]WTI08583.1 LysR family transcriptional regulator [Micromonospora sp. NBC_00821]
MNTEMLRTFVTAASSGSVSEAAKKLRYGKSTVLYHIREVEKVCRVELFEREVRGLNLTRNGHVALRISQELLRIAAELKSLPPANAETRQNKRFDDGDDNVLKKRNAS